MSIVINGKEVAKKYEEILKNRVDVVVSKLGFTPILSTIIVGDNPASVTYVNMKAKACERIGLKSDIVALPNNITTEQLLDVIDDLNKNKEVVGILLQHPVPNQINERVCFDRISLDKDVDGVNSASFGLMAMGEKCFKSATPFGILRLLKEYKIELEGKKVCVVGRSAILGKPLSLMLLNENCTVTVVHSKTKNLKEILKKSDIVVGAVGRPKFIKKEWLKRGVVLVDAGYNKGNIGDIDMENCKKISSAYTPVPGGVGPMTINSLLLQTVESAEKLCENTTISM